MSISDAEIANTLKSVLPRIFASKGEFLNKHDAISSAMSQEFMKKLGLGDKIRELMKSDEVFKDNMLSSEPSTRGIGLLIYLTSHAYLRKGQFGKIASDYWRDHIAKDTKNYNLSEADKIWPDEDKIEDDFDNIKKTVKKSAAGTGDESSKTGDPTGEGGDQTPLSDLIDSRPRGIGPTDRYGIPSRGATTNVGGGLLDTTTTRIREDDPEGRAPGGDTIATGPQSVESARKVYRASLPVAGSDAVAMDEEDNLQSDALFEAFSWVPDGYGLGKNNRLHNLNRQNDNIRYGIESLYDPRREQEYANPHNMPPQFEDDRGARQLISDFTQKVRKKREAERSTDLVSKKPLKIFDDAYHRDISFQSLPTSRYPVWSKPIIKTKSSFNPTIRPPEVSHFAGVDKAKFTYQSI